VENAKQAWIADSRPQVPLVELASREFQFLQSGAASDLASFVAWPFRVAELEQVISDAVHKYNSGIQENLVAFLPGKAGSGASAVTFHTALVVLIWLDGFSRHSCVWLTCPTFRTSGRAISLPTVSVSPRPISVSKPVTSARTSFFPGIRPHNVQRYRSRRTARFLYPRSSPSA
jgi:hypothetical protein